MYNTELEQEDAMQCVELVDTDEAYENLVMAIIRLVCADYIRALKAIPKYHWDSNKGIHAREMVTECEEFFNYGISEISDMDGQYLMKECRKIACSR